jgi:flagellar hook-basal body complex protein FliE
MAIDKIGTVGSLAPTRSIFTDLEKDNTISGVTVPFSDYLKQALNSTNDLLIQSQNLFDAFAAGETDNIAQVVLMAEKADIAFQFTMQIRNKIMDAYSEIMRMSI